jgi:hypothetical protein
VSRGEKETWNSKVAQSDLNEFVTPTERANWNAAANATTAVTKTKLSDFDSNDDSKHYTVEEKTKLAGVAANAEVNVNADWTVTNGDAQILNKPTLGDLAAKDKISNVDIASDAAISLSKIDGQIVTYTSDENSNVTFNKDPSLKVSGGGNTTLGQSIEDFVIDNDKIKNAIIVAVKTAIEDKTSELYKKVILAALPIGSIIMWDNSTTPPCGWEIHAEFNGTKNQ